MAQEQSERIEALRGLIGRLSAPDLTLAEAKLLRVCLSDLLEPGESGPPARGDGRGPEVWPPDRPIRAAG